MRSALLFFAVAVVGSVRGAEQPVRGEISDMATGKLVACRIYVRSEAGEWYFPRAEGKNGTAVPYKKTRGASAEMHTALSAHPFVLVLPSGRYTFTIERGKEFLPEARVVEVGDQPLDLKFKLRRWVDMSQLGWFAGETHVHRTLDELPTLMLAEDLNVAFPLTYWVTEAFTSPLTARKGSLQRIDPRPIAIDATHVIYPLNTEYEIFNVGKERHTLGAFFVLNHKTPLDIGVPPVRPVVERVRREGALIELDKHNWPWSMALVPIANVDLFELANNHVWRTDFGFGSFGEPAPAYMKIEQDKNGFTEKGWLDYGFQNYYALLNCGFRLRPTAGTASGVHPVPLGFGRVYVNCPEGFSYDAWLRGLDRGASFVSTGPMLLATVDGKNPGHFVKLESPRDLPVAGNVQSPGQLERIEIVVNGEVVKTVKPTNVKTERGGYESTIEERLRMTGSGWLIVRCFEVDAKGRTRFAHTAPWHFEIPGKPLRPTQAQRDFLIRRVEEQINRSKEVLPAAALDEYRTALRAFQKIEYERSRR